MERRTAESRLPVRAARGLPRARFVASGKSITLTGGGCRRSRLNRARWSRLYSQSLHSERVLRRVNACAPRDGYSIYEMVMKMRFLGCWVKQSEVEVVKLYCFLFGMAGFKITLQITKRLGINGESECTNFGTNLVAVSGEVNSLHVLMVNSCAWVLKPTN